MSRARGGFTLLEVLAVVALTSLVLGVALDFYLDLSQASNRASQHTRDVRRATALLDRVARDFESAVLVTKPPETDPLAHPWLFLAESHLAANGSDHIKFVSRNHAPRSSEAPESDLAVVAYSVRRAEDETLELMRWSSPRLPESLDTSIPGEERDGALLMADGLGSFAVRFLDPDGEWTNTWNSTTLVESSELPRAVEIEVAMADADVEDPEELALFSRRVVLPMRPVDLQVLLDPQLAAARSGTQTEADAEGEDGEEDGNAPGENGDQEQAANDCSDPASPLRQKTVFECINRAVIGERVNELKARFEQYLDDPFCRWEPVIPPFIVHRSCK